MSRCVICGARAAGSKAPMCDDLCKRAKQNGLTRLQQLEADEKEPYPERDGRGCAICGGHFCICAEP